MPKDRSGLALLIFIFLVLILAQKEDQKGVPVEHFTLL